MQIRHLFRFILPLALLLTLAACQKTGEHAVIDHTDTVPYPLEDALDLIAPGNQLLAEITRTDTVTREEAEAFLAGLDEVYPPDSMTSGPWAWMFFNNLQWDDPTLQTLDLNQELFYPTVYHEDIAVTNAAVTDVYYSSPLSTTEFDLATYLTVTISYVGDLADLEGWQRVYVYKKWSDGQWHISQLVGQDNLRLNFRTLPLRNGETSHWPQDYLREDWNPGHSVDISLFQ